jgi:hypothetical protein
MKSLEAPSLSFRDYRLPVIALVVFLIILFHSLFPKSFFNQSYSTGHYRFYPQGLGFFISDLSLFNYHSAEKIESIILDSFPKNIQDNAKEVIRPALVLAEKYQLDPFWVLSVIWTESHFKLKAKSSKGAKGLMQLMPQTYESVYSQMKDSGIRFEAHQDLRYLKNRYPQALASFGLDPFKSKMLNLEIGIFYLKDLMSNFSGNYLHATVAYNMGPYWTKYRLKNNLPVGKKNQYLSKVLNAYFHLTQNLSLGSSFRLIAKNP